MPENLSTPIPVSHWEKAPDAPDVRPLELHLWCGRTAVSDALVMDLASSLPEEERGRAARLRRPDARRHYVAGRTLLRRVLGAVLCVPPSGIRFAYSAAGKPSLSSPANDTLRFSLSHAGDMILVALAHGMDVGVDVERVRGVPAAERIALRMFETPTLGVLRSLSAQDRVLAFLHAWTQREAVVKAIGGRLFSTRDPLPFGWPRPPRALRVPAGDEESEWSVLTPSLGPAWVATAVALGGIERVRQWTMAIA